MRQMSLAVFRPSSLLLSARLGVSSPLQRLPLCRFYAGTRKGGAGEPHVIGSENLPQSGAFDALPEEEKEANAEAINAAAPTLSKEKQRIIGRKLCYSQQKLGLVADLIRGMSVKEAMRQLDVSLKKGAPMIQKLLRKGVANASHNLNLRPELLHISEIFVTKGHSLKKVDIKGRGRRGLIERPRSHVNITLEERYVLTRGQRYELRLQEALARTRLRTPRRIYGLPFIQV